jgi:hypothetical protein
MIPALFGTFIADSFVDSLEIARVSFLAARTQRQSMDMYASGTCVYLYAFCFLFHHTTILSRILDAYPARLRPKFNITVHACLCACESAMYECFFVWFLLATNAKASEKFLHSII